MPESLRWELIPGPESLVNEQPNGARLIIECNEFRSPLRNKERVLELARQLVAAPNEATLRDRAAAATAILAGATEIPADIVPDDNPNVWHHERR